MLPTVVLIQAEADLDERTPLGPLGLADEVQAGLQRRAVGLARVAFDAGAHDVLPRGRAATVARKHVIQIQIPPVKDAPAILAGVLVALKNVVARELDFLFGQPVKGEQQNHLGDADFEGDGADAFRMRLLLGNVVPLVERISLKRPVSAIQHDLRMPLKQQRQRTPRGADIDCLPQPVEHQHMLIKHGTHNPRIVWGNYTKPTCLSTRLRARY